MTAPTPHDALARQWQLLRLLPQRGAGRSALELTRALHTEGFRASKRTVERDLQRLSGLFPLQCNDQSEPYGWRWMEGRGVDLPSLSVSEALSLRLLAQHLRPLLPASLLAVLEARFQLAEAKLAALGGNPTARWAEKVRSVPPALNLIPPVVNAEVLDAVKEALLADQQLEVAYHSARAAAARTLCLNPLALVQRGPVTYLVANVQGYADIRLFALHRMSAPCPLTVAVQRPAGFSLNQYLASGALDFGGGEGLPLVARVSPALARILEETPLSADQQCVMQADGGGRLTATVQDSWQLRWWILSQGEGFVVEAPPALREAVAQSLRAAAAAYDAAPGAASA